MMDNTCVSCGAVIPEGWQVCPACYSAVSDVFEKIWALVAKASRAAAFVLKFYPNKRVLHLALYSKNPRVKEKNMRRILQWFKRKDFVKWLKSNG